MTLEPRTPEAQDRDASSELVQKKVWRAAVLTPKHQVTTSRHYKADEFVLR